MGIATAGGIATGEGGDCNRSSGIPPDVMAPHAPGAYIAFTISSTIFFASENSIMVLSRKNSSFSIPA